MHTVQTLTHTHTSSNSTYRDNMIDKNIMSIRYVYIRNDGKDLEILLSVVFFFSRLVATSKCNWQYSKSGASTANGVFCSLSFFTPMCISFTSYWRPYNTLIWFQQDKREKSTENASMEWNADIIFFYSRPKNTASCFNWIYENIWLEFSFINCNF